VTGLPVFAASVVALWLCAWFGAQVLSARVAPDRETRADFNLVLAAALTLLGLVIGFTFSMASGRYDQRKNYEAVEANAIGTEYQRAGLLGAADAAKVRLLLGRYLDERILWYSIRDQRRLPQINAETSEMQAQLWSVVQAAALAQPNAVTVLVATGMNEVIDSQGYTQAAWWNRLPVAAWTLMVVIAMLGNLLVGVSYGKAHGQPVLLVILPIVVSIAFFLIADIESPRSGVIHVAPQNLLALSAELH
jgi:hypothetical protein